MMSTLSPLGALDIMTSYAASIDDQVSIMTIRDFHWIHFFHRLKTVLSAL